MLIKNSLQEISTIYAVIEELGYCNNFGEELIDQICICMDEIFSNIIMYAYDDDMEHYIEVICTFSEGDRILTITIVDDGKEFNPLEVKLPDLTLDVVEREIGGLGVFIVSNIMDEIQYRRVGIKNELILKKSFVN